ncbi:signal transduction histidine kinase [Deinococcus metalli]|uniref:histidine kinase n=1 Tax=Deinococcus metalli TaxID=1141878 RepID=A0A7W8KEU1_9DEIO|nr:HAMP domain-containing sensor histidine kinase [Deinococcus metalli]MBB5376870.1 signal transduction histidine kinase [Deinococcus metalli]GHF45971.1 two-component sensor histidine kinase [Deinococcus metalli]
MTLRWRLTLFYTALLAALLLVVGVTTLYLMRNSLIDALDKDMLETYTRFAATSTTISLNSCDPDAAPNDQGPDAGLTSRYLFSNSNLQVEQLPFYTQQGLMGSLGGANGKATLSTLRYVQEYTRSSLGFDCAFPVKLTDAQLSDLIRSSGGRLYLNYPRRDSINAQPVPIRLLVVLAPVRQATSILPGDEDTVLSLVYVGRSMDDLNTTLTRLRSVILLLFLAGLVTAGTGAYLLAGQALRPLRQVQRAAEKIGGQTLAQRVPEPATGDEVQSLAQALNGMLGRLEASFEAQRRFTSDASHELRTPVTAISGHASYLLRRTSPTGQQQESLNIIQNESERLTNLIASLLELARSDSGALVMQKAPILSTLFLTEIGRELGPLAQAQQTTIRVMGQEVAFEGDPDRLKQVIINLLSNALKAGAKTITLQSQAVLDGQQVRLSVRDDGPGIPPDQLERLFDRFYRLEDSRSRDQGGAGLGLSIARGIVDAHGGRIWLESTVGEGTAAHVQLPVGNIPDLDDEDVP